MPGTQVKDQNAAMSEPTAVVFDMDGTLTDTEDTWDEVRRDLAAEDGIEWPDEATRAMMGMSTQQWSTYLSEHVGLSGTPEDAARRTIAGMVKAYHQGLDVQPGAEHAIARMAARGPIGLATSSPRALIDAALRIMGVTHLFATTLSTEELGGGAGKPAPDVYLEVCRRLGVRPERAVAVEDSSVGIRAAKAAGMAVVAIPPHFHPPSAETLGLADVVLPSLDELTTELVDGLLARR